MATGVFIVVNPPRYWLPFEFRDRQQNRNKKGPNKKKKKETEGNIFIALARDTFMAVLTTY